MHDLAVLGDKRQVGSVLQAGMMAPAVSAKDAIITVLAPTDTAFGAIPMDDIDALLDHKEALSAVRFLTTFHELAPISK